MAKAWPMKRECSVPPQGGLLGWIVLAEIILLQVKGALHKAAARFAYSSLTTMNIPQSAYGRMRRTADDQILGGVIATSAVARESQCGALPQQAPHDPFVWRRVWCARIWAPLKFMTENAYTASRVSIDRLSHIVHWTRRVSRFKIFDQMTEAWQNDASPLLQSIIGHPHIKAWLSFPTRHWPSNSLLMFCSSHIQDLFSAGSEISRIKGFSKKLLEGDGVRKASGLVFVSELSNLIRLRSVRTRPFCGFGA